MVFARLPGTKNTVLNPEAVAPPYRAASRFVGTRPPRKPLTANLIGVGGQVATRPEYAALRGKPKRHVR